MGKKLDAMKEAANKAKRREPVAAEKPEPPKEHGPATIAATPAEPPPPAGPQPVSDKDGKRAMRKIRPVMMRKEDGRGRLPDGSRFDVAWSAEKGRWAGTLTIPGQPEFRDDASAVFVLLMKLDTQYRRFTGEMPTPPAKAPVTDPGSAAREVANG